MQTFIQPTLAAFHAQAMVCDSLHHCFHAARWHSQAFHLDPAGCYRPPDAWSASYGPGRPGRSEPSSPLQRLTQTKVRAFEVCVSLCAPVRCAGKGLVSAAPPALPPCESALLSSVCCLRGAAPNRSKHANTMLTELSFHCHHFLLFNS